MTAPAPTTASQLRFPHWLVLIGAGLIVLALVLVLCRGSLTTNRHDQGQGVVMITRDQPTEITLWCFAGVAAVLGIGMTLVGVARWPDSPARDSSSLEC